MAYGSISVSDALHPSKEAAESWAGPLLWHFENSPTTSATGESSIELSLDEVKAMAQLVGFDIHVSPQTRRWSTS